MNRSTWLGRLFRDDRQLARKELLKIARRYNGNSTRIAIELGIVRHHLYRIIWREALWHELDTIRANAKDHPLETGHDNLLSRASQLLRSTTLTQ